MKYCPNCGAQLSDNANFCGSCGTRIGASQPQFNEQQPKQKMFSMDNFRANRAAQKQRLAKMKWWHWALIAIGVTMLTMMKLGA
jgi:uncharacterized membrane protein YvbJ